MKPRFLTAGAKILSSTPEEAKAFADKERATWKQIVAIALLLIDRAEGNQTQAAQLPGHRSGIRSGKD